MPKLSKRDQRVEATKELLWEQSALSAGRSLPPCACACQRFGDLACVLNEKMSSWIQCPVLQSDHADRHSREW
jgi:hypothetical protein